MPTLMDQVNAGWRAYKQLSVSPVELAYLNDEELNLLANNAPNLRDDLLDFKQSPEIVKLKKKLKADIELFEAEEDHRLDIEQVQTDAEHAAAQGVDFQWPVDVRKSMWLSRPSESEKLMRKMEKEWNDERERVDRLLAEAFKNRVFYTPLEMQDIEAELKRILRSTSDDETDGEEDEDIPSLTPDRTPASSTSSESSGLPGSSTYGRYGLKSAIRAPSRRQKIWL